MATRKPLPAPPMPPHGAVARTWSEVVVLAGFMDDIHVQKVFGDYLAALAPADRATLSAAMEVARGAAAALPPVDLGGVETGALVCPEVDAILADPVFQATFQDRPCHFAWVKADRLIAVQASVRSRWDAAPGEGGGLIDRCLPRKWDIPVDISLTPPNGPILFSTGAPTLAGLRIEKDELSGKVTLAPVLHINLIIVREFAGRYYLRNGYHRIYDFLAHGRTRIPALVFPAAQPLELELGAHGFGAGHLLSLPRPPLVADFLGQAALAARVREHRYGISVTLDMQQLTIPI